MRHSLHAMPLVMFELMFLLAFGIKLPLAKVFQNFKAMKSKSMKATKPMKAMKSMKASIGEMSQAPLQASQGGPGPVDGGRLRTPRRCHAHPV